MNSVIKATLFLSILVPLGVQAQAIPANLKSMFPKENSKGKSTVDLTSLTVDQRNFQMQGTKFDPDGYLRVEVSNQYVEMLSEIEIDKVFKNEKLKSDLSVNGYKLLGMQDEGPYKKNFGFGGRFGTEIYLTAWKYKEEGASIVITNDFINQRIAGDPTTLSLAFSNGSSKCIWKIFVAGDEISYDIMINDSFVDGKPKLNVQKVMSIASKLVPFAKEYL